MKRALVAAMVIAIAMAGCAGADGEMGPRGVRGLPGAPGPAGEGSVVVDAAFCSFASEDPFVISHTLALVFDSGWVFADIRFSDLDDFVSFSRFFPPGSILTEGYLPSFDSGLAVEIIRQTMDLEAGTWEVTQGDRIIVSRTLQECGN